MVQLITRLFFLCTWNKDFQDLLEVRVNTEESIPYDYYDNNFANETLILKEYDSSIDFNSLVDSNEIYVIEVIEDLFWNIRENSL